MIPPGQALRMFSAAFLMGVGLGVVYGFLTPLRPRHTVLADLLFLAGVGWCLVLLAFPICDGDLRPACFFWMLLGFFLEKKWIAWLLIPVFETFWRILTTAEKKLMLPLKIFSRFAKNMFASGEKWVTIGGKPRTSVEEAPIHSANK